jgi:hypothetical protein
MFKVIRASFFGLALFTAEAVAAGSYYCQSCGNPYTASGRQTFANFAHNLAWGSNPVRINYNGTGGRANTGWNNAAWQLRVTNRRGRTVTVRYEPSAWTITKKIFGLGKGDIHTFDLVLPDGQVEPARVVYSPGKNHKLGRPAPRRGSVSEGAYDTDAYWRSGNPHDLYGGRFSGRGSQPRTIVRTESCGTERCPSWDAPPELVRSGVDSWYVDWQQPSRETRITTEEIRGGGGRNRSTRTNSTGLGLGAGLDPGKAKEH